VLWTRVKVRCRSLRHRGRPSRSTKRRRAAENRPAFASPRSNSSIRLTEKLAPSTLGYFAVWLSNHHWQYSHTITTSPSFSPLPLQPLTRHSPSSARPTPVFLNPDVSSGPTLRLLASFRQIRQQTAHVRTKHPLLRHPSKGPRASTSHRPPITSHQQPRYNQFMRFALLTALCLCLLPAIPAQEKPKSAPVRIG
jgi:hypothetical protein